MQNSITKSPFRIYYNATTGSASTTAVITENSLRIANMGARVIALGDTFTEFRVSKLHVESVVVQFAGGTSAPDDFQAIHAIGFTAANPTDFVTPASFAEFVDLPNFCYGNVSHKLRFTVGVVGLYASTPSKWYNTSNANGNFSAGSIEMFIANSVAITGVQATQHVVVSGIIEFRGPIDPADVPISHLKNQLNDLQNLLSRRIQSEEEKKIEKDWKDEDLNHINLRPK